MPRKGKGKKYHEHIMRPEIKAKFQALIDKGKEDSLNKKFTVPERVWRWDTLEDVTFR